MNWVIKMRIKDFLVEKWGSGTELNNCWTQKKLSFISNDARLNILFNPIPDVSSYSKFFGEASSKQLLDFYRHYNGCKLFSGSLCVYGMQNQSNDLYQTYDLEWENQRVHQMLGLKGYLIFGSLGGQYLFAFKTDSRDETVYCIDVDNGDVIRSFENFDTLFSTLFNRLYEEYDEIGCKIHRNLKLKNIKPLFNVTFEKEFLEDK